MRGNSSCENDVISSGVVVVVCGVLPCAYGGGTAPLSLLLSWCDMWHEHARRHPVGRPKGVQALDYTFKFSVMSLHLM